MNKTFQRVAAENFSSGLESLNFYENTEAAQIINDFVAEKTHNKIENFISKDVINNEIVAILINAIYFKGSWKHKFDKTLTAPDNFYINENETVRTDFMTMTEEFHIRYLHDLEASALQMEYTNSKYSFIILLPWDRTRLSKLENRLKMGDLRKAFGFGSKQKVDVKIPKFKAEMTIELENFLKNVCKYMDTNWYFDLKLHLGCLFFSWVWLTCLIQSTLISVDF